MREANRFSIKIRQRKVFPFGEGVFQTQQSDMNQPCDFKGGDWRDEALRTQIGQLAPGFRAEPFRIFLAPNPNVGVEQIDISMHEPIFFHGRMDDVALDFHPAFQGAQSHPLFLLHDRLDSRERFAAQRDDQRLFRFLNLLK